MHPLLASFFSSKETEKPVTENDLQLAAAALLFETIRADGRLEGDETDTLLATLKDQWQLDDSQAKALHDNAHQQVQDATDIFQFTSLLREHWPYERKLELMDRMWQLAYSDGALASDEEYTIRKVADLLYVAHSDYIRAKLKVLKG